MFAVQSIIMALISSVKNFLRISVLILCFVGFIWQIRTIWQNFLEDFEGTSLEHINKDSIKFPVIYVCLQKAFIPNTLQYNLSKESFLERVRKFEMKVSTWSSVNLTNHLSYVHFWENGYCAKFKTDYELQQHEFIYFELLSVDGMPANSSLKVIL